MQATRVAGLLYLALAIVAPFSMIYVPSHVATLGQVNEHAALFRAGIVVDAAVVLIEIVLTAVLFRLFENVHRPLATVAAFARLAMAGLQGANIAVSLCTLRLAELGRADAVLVSLRAHADAVFVWQACFALHCAVLAVLVYRSQFLPRAIGLLMGVAALGYFVDSFGRFAWPLYGERLGWLVVPMVLPGELALTAWLIVGRSSAAGVLAGARA